MPARRLVLVVVSALLGCGPPPPMPVRPPADKPAAVGSSAEAGELGPLVRIGRTDDRLGAADGPLHPDGVADFAFKIRISGSVTAIVLTNTDVHGKPAAHEIWDTFCGSTSIPTSLGLLSHTGGETSSLAVVDEKGNTLNPEGTLKPQTFAREGEMITIYAPDPWNHLREGRVFSLLVVRPTGRIDRSTVVLVGSGV